MLRNYIKIAMRNIRNHKIFTAINILGLTVGFAIFSLIILYAQHEFSYDKFNEKIANIYRLDYKDWAIMAPAHSEYVKEKVSLVKNAVRFDVMSGRGKLIEIDEKQFSLPYFVFADESLFDIFSINILTGNIADFKSKKEAVFLSESSAKKMFGDENPIGKIFTLNKKVDLEIVGIFQDLPPSHINMDAIGNFQIMPILRDDADLLERFSGANWPTYLLLEEGANPEIVEKQLNNDPFYTNDGTKESYFKLHPLQTLYFNRSANYEMGTNHGNMKLIQSLLLIGIFIILMAAINFINLTTALSEIRNKEIGVRKVLGSHKSNLITQFLLEAIIISLLSFLLSLVVIELLLPIFNQLFLTEMKFFVFANTGIIFSLGLFAILIGIFSGIYPAFYLSSREVSKVFSNHRVSFLKGGFLRNILTVIQIAISTFLIISTFIVYQQLNFLRKKDLGMNIDNVITFSMNEKMKPKEDVLRSKLLANPFIENVSFSNQTPGNIGWQECRSINGSQHQFTFNLCDKEFFDLYDIKVIKGEIFSSDKYTEVLINETAMNKFGLNLENVIGAKLGEGKGAFKVIGLVKDFHFNSMYNKIAPLVITGYDNWNYAVNVRLVDNHFEEGLDFVRTTFNEFSTGFPFRYGNLSTRFDSFYTKEERLGELFIFFSIIAIAIAALGLFGLSAFQTKRRFKEIGVRKVLGASSIDIVLAIMKSIFPVALIAAIIAVFSNTIIMQRWLDSFSYRISLDSISYFKGVFISLIIVLASVGIVANHAAKQDPVKSLKDE